MAYDFSNHRFLALIPTAMTWIPPVQQTLSPVRKWRLVLSVTFMPVSHQWHEHPPGQPFLLMAGFIAR